MVLIGKNPQRTTLTFLFVSNLFQYQLIFLNQIQMVYCCYRCCCPHYLYWMPNTYAKCQILIKEFSIHRKLLQMMLLLMNFFDLIANESNSHQSTISLFCIQTLGSLTKKCSSLKYFQKKNFFWQIFSSIKTKNKRKKIFSERNLA